MLLFILFNKEDFPISVGTLPDNGYICTLKPEKIWKKD